MAHILEILNTRELATLLWGLLFFVWLIVKVNLSKQILSVFKSMLPLWWLFVSMSIYTIASVWILYELGLWEVSVDPVKVVVYWFFGSAVIMAFNINKIGKQDKYIRKLIIESVNLAVVISFIVNFYTFSFITELILVPIITALITFAAFSEINKEHIEVSKFLNWIMSVFGIMVIFNAIYKAIINYKEFASMSTFYEFITPVLLTVMFLPYLYALFLYSKYEQESIRRKFSAKHG